MGLIFSLISAQNSSLFFRPQTGSVQRLAIDKVTGDNYVTFGTGSSTGILKLNSSGVDQGAVANEATSLINIDENSNLYYVLMNTSDVKKVDMQNINNPTTVFTRQGTSPTGMCVSGNKLYYSDQMMASIYYVDSINQTPSSPTVLFSQTGYTPSVLYAKGGFLYAILGGMMPGTSKIVKIDLANPSAGAVDVVTGLTNAGYLAVDNIGKIYYTRRNTTTNTTVLDRYTPSLGTSDTIDNGSNGNFLALDVDANGSVFFTAYNPNNGSPFSALYKISAASLSTNSVATKTLSISPNPAKDFVTISNLSKGAEVALFDVTGKLLYQTKSLGVTLTINTSSYKNGMYLVKVDGQTSKLMISK